MKPLWISLLVLTVIVTLVSTPVSVKARARLADTIASIPSECPVSGCAAGQRLNINASITITSGYTGGPNTQVCLFTLTDGISGSGTGDWIDTTSFSSTVPSGYTPGETEALCTNNTPANYSVIYSAYGQRATGTDSLSFAFRINKTTDLSGSLYLYNFQYNGASWDNTAQNIYYPIAPTAIFSYVASSAGNCGIYNPCYLNSGDDLAGGIGTGLKDAVDASPVNGTITILGNYLIKSNTVTLNNPQTVRGINDASLTYTGASCNNAMLQLTGGVTIQDLNINDGSNCTSTSRDLILINSASNVSLLYNDLVNGRDAISILDNSGNVSVRYNHITGNSGYGILHASGSGTGIVRAVANNIYGNRTGHQAACNNKGEVNHNFWGLGISPSSAISGCSYTDGKRLGAAILQKADMPGVIAETITLTSTKTSYMDDNSIAVDGTPGVKLIIANHGHSGLNSIPFLGSGTSNLVACNNFIDIFLSEENTIIPSLVNLYLPYNLVAGCEAVIEATGDYCASLNQADYPLLWYDPQYSVTTGWDTTGQTPSGPGASGMSGQTTTCNTASNEVRVAIDANANERPNLVSDLNYTPFTVGYPNADIVFSSFAAISGIAKVDLNWETTKESGLKGYYVTRSLNPYGPYNRDSELILAKGNDTIGGIYHFSDTGLNNGTTYWYMLEMIDSSDLQIGFEGPLSATTYGMVPMATTISPNSAIAGGIALSITVTGTNFLPTSRVRWDGSDLETSFISATELNAVIPSALITTASTHNITVYNPSPGGGTSTVVVFTVNNPVPTIIDISPDEINQASADFSLTVDGTNFVCTANDATKLSTVRWAGSSTGITITSCTGTRLIATIPTAKVATAGTYAVTVYNPSPGGGTTSSLSFKVIASTPTKTATRTATKIPTQYRTSTSRYRSPTPVRARTNTPTRTRTGTILITPSSTAGKNTPNTTLDTTPGATTIGQLTPEPLTLTPTLLPGEPTYTPVPPMPEEEEPETSVWTWRLLSIFRILGGSLVGFGLLSIPAFLIFRKKTKIKSTR